MHAGCCGLAWIACFAPLPLSQSCHLRCPFQMVGLAENHCLSLHSYCSNLFFFFFLKKRQIILPIQEANSSILHQSPNSFEGARKVAWSGRFPEPEISEVEPGDVIRLTALEKWQEYLVPVSKRNSGHPEQSQRGKKRFGTAAVSGGPHINTSWGLGSLFFPRKPEI